MLKLPITYRDLDDNEITEVFWFNLSKAEITEMELLEKEGLNEKLKRVTADDDRVELLRMFKDLIGRTIGRRSEDGKRFIKSDQIREEFMQSDAYSELFMSFFTMPGSAANFINGTVPASLSKQIPGQEELPLSEVQLPTEGSVKPIRKLADYSEEEILAMDEETFTLVTTRVPRREWPQFVLLNAMDRVTRRP